MISPNTPGGLQWGHASRAWKTGSVAYDLDGALELQWGHASRAWKTSRRRVARPDRQTLQWGHASRAWKTTPRTITPIPSVSGFNGATPQGRGRHTPNRESLRATLASMGPRLKGVEDWSGQWLSRPTRSRFNGATPQGRGRRRKQGCRDSLDLASMGPRLKGVEDSLQSCQPRERDAASMGPRLKGVEDVSAEPRRASNPPRFNGATPQGRGRPARVSATQVRLTGLQWGHASRAWKTCN